MSVQDDGGLAVLKWRNARGVGTARLTKALALARSLAERMREAVRAGLDPRTVRQAAAPKPTFGEIAADYIATHRSGWKNPKHAAQWETTFRVYAAKLGPVPVDQVALTHVLEVLKPLWLDLPETATRVRSRIELVLDAAAAKGHRPNDNPARWKGSLKHWLSAPQRLKRGHMAAVPYREIPDVIARLRGLQSISARALEFLILTAARTNEVRGLVWPELDLEAKVWTIPQERMKGKREHRVPLSDRTLELATLYQDAGEPYVFPGLYKGEPLSDMAMLQCLRGIRPGMTVHGFRSSFRDWAGDCTSHPREIIEAALAHTIGNKAEQAYRRSDALERRRSLMSSWCSYCEPGTGGNVVKMSR